MSILHWRGTISSVFNLAANWLENAAPGNGDDIVFDAALADGANSPAGGDYSAIALNRIAVGADYDGTIASSDAPLIVGADYILINAVKAGDQYWESAAWGDVYVSDTGDGELNLDISVDTLYIMKGRVNLLAGSSIADTLVLSYKKMPTNDVILDIASGCTLPAVIEQTNGFVTCASAITTLRQADGVWQQSGNVTSLMLYGGTFDWRSGTITAADVYIATLDGSLSVAQRTLTTLTMRVGSQIWLNDRVGSISVTNPVYYDGGLIEIAPQKTIAYAA